MNSTLLTPREAAEYRKASPSTLAKERCKGDGPPFVKMGRSVRYRRADLDEWIAANIRRSTSDTPERGIRRAGKEATDVRTS